jgi:predicted GNAT family acetyltransferase
MQFLCLFYNNPEAGAIYRRIGFREMGAYMILSEPVVGRD